MPQRSEFTLHLFDDDSVREKLTVMGGLEAAFDDERNHVPTSYYETVDLQPGESLRIIVEKFRPVVVDNNHIVS